MILWTIQPESAWSELCSTGRLRTNYALLREEYGDTWMFQQDCYDWLVEQMSKRLVPAPFTEAYPLWGWYQLHGPNKKRPDLRKRRPRYIADQHRAVRIEIDIPDNEVLLSDFDLWEIVMMGQYIPLTKKEDDVWEKALIQEGLQHVRWRLGLPEERRVQLEKSWERIFDLTFTSRYLRTCRARQAIQATFWELRFDQVRDVTHFVGR